MTTDVALPSERNAQPPSIATLIAQMQPEIQRALPKGMDGDRIARLALTVVRQNPQLANASPASFAGALLTAAALGLEPGVNGEAYLVPYKRECQLIIGYQGYAKLFWNNPLARHIDAQAVYANDEFDYAYGTEPFLRHKPAKGDRGDLVAYYAVASLSTGGSSSNQMPSSVSVCHAVRPSLYALNVHWETVPVGSCLTRIVSTASGTPRARLMSTMLAAGMVPVCHWPIGPRRRRCGPSRVSSDVSLPTQRRGARR